MASYKIKYISCILWSCYYSIYFVQLFIDEQGNLTSAIMELYQYKMAAMNQNLRQLQMSQEAADLRSTRLQHNLCLTNSEVSRLHQLLYGSQQSLELAIKETNSLAGQLSQVKQEAQQTHNKYSEVCNIIIYYYNIIALL